MNDKSFLPRVLIIDDLFGRTHPNRRNEERANLCGQYLIEDVTGDEVGKGTPQKIKKPIAQAVFYRGQMPTCSTVGDTVENDLEGALQVIREGWLEWQPNKPRWAMALLDLCFYTGRVTEESNRKTLGMPEGRDGDDNPSHYFGLCILQAIHDEFPDLPVIILSSKLREEVSREFSKRGARGFLAREAEDSPDLLRKYLWRHGLIPDDMGEIVGHSKALLLSLRAARRAASSRQNLLIRGERGTGKELLARYIHQHSQNQESSPFIVVNSSILTPELFASELFGIEKRVATNVDKRDGLIKEADGGDLFLDEISDMLLQVQAGILRVLEERKITPVGAKIPQSVDVRFLSATNIDIEALAATDSFRSDLLDRLREGGTLLLPPLRNRVEDIPLLVEKFVRDAEHANPNALSPNALRRQIEPEVLNMLCVHNWPGNIRELRDCIFGAVNNYPDVEHLVPVHIQLPSVKKSSDTVEVIAPTAVPPTDSEELEAAPLDEVFRVLSGVTFESANPAHLAGKLPEMQGAYARFLALYLKAALEATRKPTPEKPDGEVLIHPAMKLITGDTKLTASKAADMIKRLLGISPEAAELLLVDAILREAYETALRLRPKQPKSMEKRQQKKGKTGKHSMK
jgi:DNA-binding NtrC family response regulator